MPTAATAETTHVYVQKPVETYCTRMQNRKKNVRPQTKKDRSHWENT